MNAHNMPSRQSMMKAFLRRDKSYQGIFFTGVRSTGVFCRVGCPARTPRPTQLEFFATARDALFAGFRPCKRCRPIEPPGSPPEWLKTLLKAVESDPHSRWTDADIRALRLHPDRVRRWFQKIHGMTFHAYARARRLGLALERIRKGTSVLDAALDTGYDSISGFNEAFRNVIGASPKTARSSTVVHIARIATPLGPMIACASGSALCLLEFADRRMLETQLKRIQRLLGCMFVPSTNAIIEKLEKELSEYFRGQRREFSVPLYTDGTPFQETVWKRLRRIPYGETVSYRDVAEAIKAPNSVRAVARANGDNRICIIVPCHRVIGSDGSLTGYGGGLWRKQRLLELEKSEGKDVSL
ncbi:MAG: bifunctional transcriptional activator/DNA repair protein Ada [Acidobacteria bacterium]|nr:bifunctional transcriptional activator/DNA repair protein Ada [Acidobacteriota bacterium]